MVGKPAYIKALDGQASIIQMLTGKTDFYRASNLRRYGKNDS